MRLTEVFTELTAKQLLAGVAGEIVVPRPIRKTKAALTTFITKRLTPALEKNLHDLLATHATPQTPAPAQKRKREDHSHPTRKAPRLDPDDLNDPEDSGEFLELPSEAVRKSCYQKFYEATSNAALELVVCAVCARERDRQSDRVSRMALDKIPSPSCLIPGQAHQQHTLFDGMLLQPEGIAHQGGCAVANICGECLRDLQKETGLPPRYSLANNLWLGSVPAELECLTFPEQLLIAHLYPRVYMFKLFPKSGGGPMDGMQRGMRGNVSTYELNVKAMTKMVEGKLMPRPPTVLASLITITYIGAGSLPKKWLHLTFRVRHHHVSRALRWLQANNPKYYGDITICNDQLNQLPEDDIPDAILGLIRQSNDTGLIDQESSGYVRTEDLGRFGPFPPTFHDDPTRSPKGCETGSGEMIHVADDAGSPSIDGKKYSTVMTS